MAVSALTTLATPYLIRSADGIVGWFDRHAPASVVDTLEAYTRRLLNPGASHQILADDRVFLMGKAGQIAAARDLLGGEIA